jgi:hypothetical protein
MIVENSLFAAAAHQKRTAGESPSWAGSIEREKGQAKGIQDLSGILPGTCLSSEQAAPANEFDCFPTIETPVNQPFLVYGRQGLRLPRHQRFPVDKDSPAAVMVSGVPTNFILNP